jgi:hypothetical protein
VTGVRWSLEPLILDRSMESVTCVQHEAYHRYCTD